MQVGHRFCLGIVVRGLALNSSKSVAMHKIIKNARLPTSFDSGQYQNML